MHALRSAAAVVLSSVALIAQTAPCESLNDATNNVRQLFSFGKPPGSFATGAWSWVAQTNSEIKAMEIFTNNAMMAPATRMSLSIFDVDPMTSFPRNELARGTWQINLNRGDAWQGANLDRPVQFVQGSSYWIVWEDPGSSRPPWDSDTNATAVGYALFNGSTWTSSSPMALKVRLYCSYLDDVSTFSVGDPCAQANGALGTLFSNESPQVGNTDYQVEATGFGSGEAVVWLLGVNPGFTSIPLSGAFPAGCSLHTDVVVSAVAGTGTGSVNDPTTGGHAILPLAIANDPALASAFIGVQVAVLDSTSAAPVPVVWSNSLKIFILP